MIFHVLFIAFTFFSGWHAGGKSIFMADTITDSAEFMVAPLIGNILVMINKACSVEDDMIVNMIFVDVYKRQPICCMLQRLKNSG